MLTATLKDIAKIANVSEAAVSMALRGKKGIGKESVKRIQEIAQALNYRPNLLAQGLANGFTKTIGLVVPDIENPYYASLVHSILGALLKIGYYMVLGVSNENPALEKHVIDSFITSQVAGIIIAPVNVINEQTDYLEKIHMDGMPMAFVTSYYPGVNIPHVMVDLEEGSYQLVRYLLQNGHRHIYCFTGDSRLLPYSKRIAGYKRAFDECAIPYSLDCFVECKYVTFDGAYVNTTSLLSPSQSIDAIITSNDVMALGVLRSLQEHHIDVPKDISVAGFDNVLFSTVGMLPLTTISQDINRMSEMAVSLLFKQLNGIHTDIESAPLIAPELIVRKTTGIMPSKKRQGNTQKAIEVMMK